MLNRLSSAFSFLRGMFSASDAQIVLPPLEKAVLLHGHWARMNVFDVPNECAHHREKMDEAVDSLERPAKTRSKTWTSSVLQGSLCPVSFSGNHHGGSELLSLARVRRGTELVVMANDMPQTGFAARRDS